MSDGTPPEIDPTPLPVVLDVLEGVVDHVVASRLRRDPVEPGRELINGRPSFGGRLLLE